MIPLSSLVVLDTNVLVHLIRNDRVGQKLDADYSLGARRDRPLISIVTIGELHALARKLGWGDEKQRRLDSLVRELVAVDLRQGSILRRYAEIDHFSEKKIKPARRMGQNDMWIAATASATGAHLLTSDHDFDHLAPAHLHRARIHPVSGETEAVD